jgi:hypothetical protein
MFSTNTRATIRNYPVCFIPFVIPTVMVGEVINVENKNGKDMLCYVDDDVGQPLLEERKRATNRIMRGMRLYL